MANGAGSLGTTALTTVSNFGITDISAIPSFIFLLFTALIARYCANICKYTYKIVIIQGAPLYTNTTSQTYEPDRIRVCDSI